jgi:hypothetical protein
MATHVELHLAFVFTCDHCGRDSFVRAVALEPEQTTEMVPEADREKVEGYEGNWCMKPERVKCLRCDSEFEVEPD